MSKALTIRDPEGRLEIVESWADMPKDARKRRAAWASRAGDREELQSLLQAWVLGYGRRATDSSPRTLETYSRGARRLLDWCEAKAVKPHQLTEAHARRFLASMADLAPKSRQTYLTGASAFIQALSWAGMGSGDAFEGVRVIERTARSEKIKDHYYRPAEWQALLAECDREDPERPVSAEHRARDRVILRLGIDVGLRLAEMVVLRWDDVKDGQVQVLEGKGGKARTIPTTDNLEAALTSYRTLRGDRAGNWILQSPQREVDPETGTETPRPLTRSRVQQRFQNLCERAGVEHRGVHALRHTYAMRHVRQGIAPRNLQVLLGHADISTTMIYWHVEPEDLQADQSRLNGDPELEALAMSDDS